MLHLHAAPVGLVLAGGRVHHAGRHGHSLDDRDFLVGLEGAVLIALYRAGKNHLADFVVVPVPGIHIPQTRRRKRGHAERKHECQDHCQS